MKMLLWRFLTAGSCLLVDAGAVWITDPPTANRPPRPSCFMAVVKRVQVKLQTTPEEAFKFVARVEVML